MNKFDFTLNQLHQLIPTLTSIELFELKLYNNYLKTTLNLITINYI